jgi:hypothetical protein
MAYYIIPRGSPAVTFDPGEAIHTAGEAVERANSLHQSSGNHYHVVKVETIWVTTTLADLKAEGRF